MERSCDVPPRHFDKTADENFGEVSFEWENDGTMIFDPLIHSTLRYLARDLARRGSPTHLVPNRDWLDEVSSEYPGYNASENPHLRIRNSNHRNQNRNLEDHWHYGGFQDTPQLGTAGWNDDSGISLAARETLQEAAGITPPSSTFVLKMLAVYLIVLVPINWLIFRFAGRIEFAWIAVPIISIAGAFLVVKMASLDIGFVRSNTQIGLLEIHSDYSRAHLAEYSALYTSLSTRYSAELDNLTAQSLPFALKDRGQSFTRQENPSQVVLHRTNKKRLEGFQIQSNSTGMLHTESMLDLNGVVSFAPASPQNGPALVSNSTQIDLSNVGVIGRDENGNYQIAWVGELKAGSDANCNFEPTSAAELSRPWRAIPVFHNTFGGATKIWADNVNQGKPLNSRDPTFISLDQLSTFPELQSNWPDYRRIFLQSPNRIEDRFSAQDFNDAFQILNGVSVVTVGRLFDSVINSLTLAPGEYRLIGATQQRLGRTAFDPESTQIDRQTLVVVHLTRPQLPAAKPDLNAFEDFKVVSDLDREREALELDQLLNEGRND